MHTFHLTDLSFPVQTFLKRDPHHIKTQITAEKSSRTFVCLRIVVVFTRCFKRLWLGLFRYRKKISPFWISCTSIQLSIGRIQKQNWGSFKFVKHFISNRLSSYGKIQLNVPSNKPYFTNSMLLGILHWHR